MFACFLVVQLLPLPQERALGQALPLVSDVALKTQFQDNFGLPPHQKRGRANVAADFDNDGRVDAFIGNPGDESFVVLNKMGPNGFPRFEVWQILLVGDLAWGAAAADADDDGDIDLFVTCGANEGVGFDYLFLNLCMETGRPVFQDVTEHAGVSGPTPAGQTAPVEAASANASWVDFDRDGDLDLWVNVNEYGGNPNILWRNMLRETGTLTFQNVTAQVGLNAAPLSGTRHSSWSDFDLDGDLDLYESNYQTPNVYWRNEIVETGSPTFVDETDSVSAPGDDLHFPFSTFGSAALDFNDDGYDDIIAVYRPSGGLEEQLNSPYGSWACDFHQRWGWQVFESSDGSSQE